MSAQPERRDGGPILPGTPLARALAGGTPPRLSADFAERVVAAAEARPAPLPPLRRGSGWRTGRRLAVGLAGAAALASAAAATGLLQQVVPSVPTATAVWASLSAPLRAAPAATPKSVPPPPAPDATPRPVGLAGPIDTPEKLNEVFRRADEMRTARRQMRDALIERRLADALARRKADGLPDLSPAELSALRDRIAAREANREQVVDARIKVRREVLQDRVAKGEKLTREDFLRPLTPRTPLPAGSEAFERLRRMSLPERRAALRAMAPAERAAIIEEFRARRAAAISAANGAAPDPAASASPRD